MVEATHSTKSKDLIRTHDKIKTIITHGKQLSAGEVDLHAVSAEIVKMDGRFNKVAISQTIDVLFESAQGLVTDEHSKIVIENLRKLVSQVEVDLYNPHPRYIDAFFFPNKENVKKIVNYINMAKKEIKICVFNLTNDDLASAIL
jgi:hypothetical protein